MPAAGYAYAIDPRIINKSRKRRLIVKLVGEVSLDRFNVNSQDEKFVQCVSPRKNNYQLPTTTHHMRAI